MQNLFEDLKNLLKNDKRLVDDKGEILKNKIIELFYGMLNQKYMCVFH
jgi:hypothetical protein